MIERLKNFDDEIQILFQSAQSTVPVRGLMATQVSKLVAVSGIVISASRKQAKATQITIMCRNCYNMKRIVCKEGFGGADMPQTCDASTNANPYEKESIW